MIATAVSKHTDTERRTKPYRVHAFGGGVQSLALFMAWAFDSVYMRGEVTNGYTWEGFFPDGVPDLCIFADTQNEPETVYRAVEYAREWCEAIGVPFDVVTAGDLANPPPASTGTQGIFVPLFTTKLNTDADGPAGKRGQLLRQCTSRYKIEPMMRRVEELAQGRDIEVWMGISTDEVERIKTGPSDRIRYYYPLVFPQPNERKIDTGSFAPMSRHDLITYLSDLEVPAGKSACTFCPYRSDYAWAKMKTEDPEAFEAACRYDERMRNARPGYLCFVHRSRGPLREAYFEAADPAVISLFAGVDMSQSGGCEEGYCGL